ncbi:hypothetical protein BDC45DRAFT_606155, partial [Circinella umbellata]
IALQIFTDSSSNNNLLKGVCKKSVKGTTRKQNSFYNRIISLSLRYWGHFLIGNN